MPPLRPGVHFIQVQHGAGGAGVWDAHGKLKGNHASNTSGPASPGGNFAGLSTDRNA